MGTVFPMGQDIIDAIKTTELFTPKKLEWNLKSVDFGDSIKNNPKFETKMDNNFLYVTSSDAFFTVKNTGVTDFFIEDPITILERVEADMKRKPLYTTLRKVEEDIYQLVMFRKDYRCFSNSDMICRVNRALQFLTLLSTVFVINNDNMLEYDDTQERVIDATELGF